MKTSTEDMHPPVTNVKKQTMHNNYKPNYIIDMNHTND